jgi:hypothetical protein
VGKCVGGEDVLARRKEEEDLCCHYSTNQWEWNTDLVDKLADLYAVNPCRITCISVDKGK